MDTFSSEVKPRKRFYAAAMENGISCGMENFTKIISTRFILGRKANEISIIPRTAVAKMQFDGDLHSVSQRHSATFAGRRVNRLDFPRRARFGRCFNLDQGSSISFLLIFFWYFLRKLSNFMRNTAISTTERGALGSGQSMNSRWESHKWTFRHRISIPERSPGALYTWQ